MHCDSPLAPCDPGERLAALPENSTRPLMGLSMPLVGGSLKGLWGDRLLTVKLRGSSPVKGGFKGAPDQPRMSEIMWGVGCLGGLAYTWGCHEW